MPGYNNGVMYAPRGSYAPTYGERKPQRQAMPFNIPGLGPMGNMLGGIAMGAMFPTSMYPGMRATEHSLATREEQQIKRASNFGGGTMQQAIHGAMMDKMKAYGVSSEISEWVGSQVKNAGLTNMGAISDLAKNYGGATGAAVIDSIASNMGVNAEAAQSSIASRGIYRGMRHMQGAPLIATDKTGDLAGVIAAEMTPEKMGMRSLGASQVGGIVESLGSRGLLEGRLEGASSADNKRGTIDKMKRKVKAYGGMVKGLEELFGKGKSIDELFTKLDEATQGGMSQMGASDLKNMVNQSRGLQHKYGMEGQKVTNMMAYGAQAARSLGLVPAQGAQITLDSIGIAAEMQKAQGEFYGARNFEELQGQVNNDMLMASRSSMSQKGGGMMAAIRQRGLSTGQSGETLADTARKLGGSRRVQQLMRDLESGEGDPAKMAKILSGSNMPALIDDLTSLGVDKRVAAAYLTKDTRTGQKEARKLVPMIYAAQEKRLFKELAQGDLGSVLGGREGLAMASMERITNNVDNIANDLQNGGVESTKELADLFQERFHGLSRKKAESRGANAVAAIITSMKDRGGTEMLGKKQAIRRKEEAEEQINTLLETEDTINNKAGTLGSALMGVLFAGEHGEKKAKELFGEEAYAEYSEVFEASSNLAKANAMDRGVGGPRNTRAARKKARAYEIEVAQSEMDYALNGDARAGLEDARSAKEQAKKAAAADAEAEGKKLVANVAEGTVNMKNGTIVMENKKAKKDDPGAGADGGNSSSEETNHVVDREANTGALLRESSGTKHVKAGLKGNIRNTDLLLDISG